MPVAALTRKQSGQPRFGLRARLEERREEIEAVALTRVRAIADPSEVSDPTYAEGLRAAVSTAIAYGIEAIGREASDPPIPVALLAQARMAARVGIPLDTVLRRYFAGYSLLSYFILEEAGHTGIADGPELRRLLGAQAGVFDRLLAAIGEEHARETDALPSSAGKLVESVRRLLAGEMVDTATIPYEFGGWHVGLALVGCREAERTLRDLVSRIDCRLLFLPRGEGVFWAWLGSRRRLEPTELVEILPAHLPTDCHCAIGEPAENLPGWRLTHRQAAAALSVAGRSRDPVVRYRDVALLAAVHRDELLVALLRRLYLEPLEAERDGGESAMETLRAYIAANRNVSSAAATMGITRQSARSRLRTIEIRIGRGLDECASEIDIAVRLHESDLRSESQSSNLAIAAYRSSAGDGALRD